MSNIEELKNTGLKATLPRLKILDVFQNSRQRHMTAEDVFRVLLEGRSDEAQPLQGGVIEQAVAA